MELLTLDDPETKSADLVAENVEALKALFPEAVTEGRIDFEVLKQLLGATVDERDEKYGLNWHGKRRARQIALTPSTGTLLPCPEDSVDWDTTQNLLIEGDNLEVLKLLQKSYAGKVTLIYIDPPYNTGKDFVYQDDFRDNIKNYLQLTGQLDPNGYKTTSNTESSGRFHTDWFNMMYPRLRLARNMLSKDGALFCSIDDIEVHHLRDMLDEIFGEDNFLAQFSWRTDGNFDNQAKVKICHEYVVVYAKSIDSFPHPPVVDPSIPSNSKLFRPEIRNTIVKNGPKNPVSSLTLPVGFPADFTKGRIAARKRPWPIYRNDAIVENGKLVEAIVIESGWSSKGRVLEFINNRCEAITDSRGQETVFHISRTGAIEAVKRRSEYQSHVISVLSGFGGTQKATAQLNEIGAFFNGYPKPVDLIQYFVRMILAQNATILDFFAGSGPTGHAVIKQNAADNGVRRYILVQLPEPLTDLNDLQKAAIEYCDRVGKPRNVAELTKERLRRAAGKIREESPNYDGDLGFRVYRLASSNIRAWEPNASDLDGTLLQHSEHLVPGRREQDVLNELLLKLGLDLCVSIETRLIAGKNLHSIGGGALIVCLADGVSRGLVEEMANGIVEWHRELAPAVDTRVVFKDSGFADEVAKANMAAILNQNGITDVRSL